MPTIRTNISTFFDTSATITSVTPTGQWVITPGQPANPPTAKETSQQGDPYTAFTIEFDAGRKSSSDVATEFTNLCGGADNMFGIGATDGTPGSLNFYFGVTLTLKGSLGPVTVYLAQGSEIDNNWWIGGGNIKYGQLEFISGGNLAALTISGDSSNGFIFNAS
jgi:hypothetical protein